MQTEEEEAEQEDIEPTQSIQQQCSSGKQAAEPSEKREKGKIKKQMQLVICLHLVKHSSYRSHEASKVGYLFDQMNVIL